MGKFDGLTWVATGKIDRTGRLSFFSGFVVSVNDKPNLFISINDIVLVRNNTQVPWVAKCISLFEDLVTLDRSAYVVWYSRKNDLPAHVDVPEDFTKYELVLTDHYDIIDIRSINGKTVIKSSLAEMEGIRTKNNERDFWCRYSLNEGSRELTELSGTYVNGNPGSSSSLIPQNVTEILGRLVPSKPPLKVERTKGSVGRPRGVSSSSSKYSTLVDYGNFAAETEEFYEVLSEQSVCEVKSPTKQMSYGGVKKIRVSSEYQAIIPTDLLFDTYSTTVVNSEQTGDTENAVDWDADDAMWRPPPTTDMSEESLNDYLSQVKCVRRDPTPGDVCANYSEGKFRRCCVTLTLKAKVPGGKDPVSLADDVSETWFKVFDGRTTSRVSGDAIHSAGSVPVDYALEVLYRHSYRTEEALEAIQHQVRYAEIPRPPLELVPAARMPEVHKLCNRHREDRKDAVHLDRVYDALQRSVSMKALVDFFYSYYCPAVDSNATSQLLSLLNKAASLSTVSLSRTAALTLSLAEASLPLLSPSDDESVDAEHQPTASNGSLDDLIGLHNGNSVAPGPEPQDDQLAFAVAQRSKRPRVRDSDLDCEAAEVGGRVEEAAACCRRKKLFLRSLDLMRTAAVTMQWSDCEVFIELLEKKFAGQIGAQDAQEAVSGLLSKYPTLLVEFNSFVQSAGGGL